jgi:hypothetical protein
MITLRQEQIVRECISDPKCKLTNKEIAEEAGTTHPQVIQIRRVKERYDKLTEDDRIEITNLLKMGFSAPAVSCILRTPKPNVNAVRRWEYLQRRKPGEGGPKKCPCCHCLLYGDEKNYEVDLPHRKEKDPCLQIIGDLVDLENLHLVRHPLFYHLAQRAKKVLEDAEKENAQS